MTRWQDCGPVGHPVRKRTWSLRATRVQVGLHEAHGGEAHRLVGEPRQLAEQRLGVGVHRLRGVVDAHAAARVEGDAGVVDPGAGAEARGVQHADVVHVHRVLGHQLPVAVEVPGEARRQAAPLGVEEAEILLETADEARERLGRLVEADEHAAAPGAEAQRAQAAGGGIEALRLLHVGGADQLALEVVEPAVVGAGELARVAGAAGDLDTAMGADVGRRR